MTAPAATVVDERQPGHPDWCEQGHHCTAAGGGEHASAPLVWEVTAGRVIVTRQQRADGADWVEVRHVLQLPAGERRQVEVIRVLVAIGAALLREVVRWRV